MLLSLSVSQLIKSCRGNPSNHWTHRKCACICVCVGVGWLCIYGQRSDVSHSTVMGGERLQWHTAGILWHRKTPPGSLFPCFCCLSLSLCHPVFSPLPLHYSFQRFFLSCPSHFCTHQLILSLQSTNWCHVPRPISFTFSILSFLCQPTFLIRCPFLPPPPICPVHNLLSTARRQWFSATRCECLMTTPMSFYKPPLLSASPRIFFLFSFLYFFLPLSFQPTTFTSSLLLYLLARSHPAV